MMMVKHTLITKNKTMPRTNIKELGLNPEQARNIFTGLSREEAGAKVEELKAQNSQNQSQVESFTDKVNAINDAKKSDYKSMAVGNNPFTRSTEEGGWLAKRLYKMTPVGGLKNAKNYWTGGKESFMANVEQLTNQETIDNLLAVKAAGGTFGALNEAELDLLINSATKIGYWKQKDDSGKVVGYKVGEKEFDKELDTLARLANKAISRAGGTPVGGNTGQTSNGIKYEIVQ